jgi:hypothetical protein
MIDRLSGSGIPEATAKVPELRQIVARLVELRAEGDRAMALPLPEREKTTVDTLFQRLLKLPGETDRALDPVENALSQLDSESARFIFRCPHELGDARPVFAAVGAVQYGARNEEAARR